jgi:hypothetical protein
MEIGLVIIAVMLVGAFLCARSEKRDWNGGKCDCCGNDWEHFDNDSQGGRGYKCKCIRYIWISWPVDK